MNQQKIRCMDCKYFKYILSDKKRPTRFDKPLCIKFDFPKDVLINLERPRADTGHRCKYFEKRNPLKK